MTEPTRGGMTRVTGELLAELLKLPDDAVILKVVPSQQGNYTFDVIYVSTEGPEIAEGNYFPVMMRSNYDGT